MEEQSQVRRDYFKEEIELSVNDNEQGIFCRYIDGTDLHGGKSITQNYEIVTGKGTSQFTVEISVEQKRHPATIHFHEIIHLKLLIEDDSILKGYNYIITDLTEYIKRAEKNINLKMF